jgi:uncharacterized protein YheU (UPF0270 family)
LSVHIIPINRLSREARRGVIEEFISRDGTDYGEKEALPERSFSQVKYELEKRLAILVYDNETQTTNILPADSPVAKKAKAMTGDQEE